MNSIMTKFYLLILLFLHPETSFLRLTVAFRIPASNAITRCSTVAFWSPSIIAHSDQQILMEGVSTSLNATRRNRNEENVVTFKNMEEVLECFHEEPIGVFFGQKSCGPCQSMKEEMKQVHSTFGNDLLLFHVDIDKWPSVATKMDVTLTPTLLVVQQGQVQLRLEGMIPAETILKELHSFMARRHDQR